MRQKCFLETVFVLLRKQKLYECVCTVAACPVALPLCAWESFRSLFVVSVDEEKVVNFSGSPSGELRN